MNEKISVKEYLENKDLLKLTYIPHDEKVEICRTILSQCISTFNDYSTIDSVLLNRVKTEIFIISITNLDLSIKDENELNGYDQLCYSNELYNVIQTCGYLYVQFEEILDLMVKDYYSNEGSLIGYINNTKTTIESRLSFMKNDFSEFINNLDIKEISDKIISLAKVSGMLNI